MHETLHVDFETYCDLPIRLVGMETYARHSSCELLMMGYAFDNEAPKLWIPDGPWDYNLPPDVLEHIRDNRTVVAHNIAFEWNIFKHVLGITLNYSQCKDTMALALIHGLPKSLDGAAKAAGVEHIKDTRGATLIRKFCQPRKPTKNNPETRWFPNMAEAEWEEFCEYCLTDVRVERDLWNYFGGFKLLPLEQWVYEETFRMNERGIPVDIPLAKKTIEYLEDYTASRIKRCEEITNGIPPTKVGKLLEWLQARVPVIENLQRVPLERILIDMPDLDPEVKEVIEIRLEMGRVSTKKLEKIVQVDSGDSRVRGSFIYHGAGPGRFTAVGVQPHNFQRPTIENVDRVIELLDTDPEKIAVEFDNVLEAVGSAMRGFFKAPDGKILIVADYNSIEARVLAWLARQDDAVLLFHEEKDIYCDMAGFIFGRKADDIKHGVNDHDFEAEKQRKLGKDTVLGCGYGMSMNTFLLQMESKGNTDIAGIPLRDDSRDRGTSGKETWNRDAWSMACKAVYGYREKYQRIKYLWDLMEKAAMRAISNPRSIYTINKLVRFKMFDHNLVMQLPSKRRIYYPHCRIVERENKWTENMEKAIQFRTVSERGQQVAEWMYGSKFTENAVQGIARDLLVYGMFQASKHGYPLIGTVHDEILTLCSKYKSLKRFVKLICKLPQWAIGDNLEHTIPLTADGYKAIRCRK